MKWLLYIFFLLLYSGEQNESSLSENEMELYKMIMEIRRGSGLESIHISPNLNKVAAFHVRDLGINEPIDGYCNPHSWSDQGFWEACCYDSGHSNPECMWLKPKELTDYEGLGYEIIAFQSSGIDPIWEISPHEALRLWMESPGHRKVILNQADFNQTKWKAIGIAIRGSWASVWFGEAEDAKMVE